MLEEIFVCGIIFNNRSSSETTITHLLVNWPSSTANFYTRRTSQSDLALKYAFSVHLLQDEGQDTASRAAETEGIKGQSKNQSRKLDSPVPQQVENPTHSDGHFQLPDPPEHDSKTGTTAAAQVLDCSGDVPSQFGAMWSDPPPFNVSWGSVSCQSHLGPAHNGRGTYVYRLSPSGDVSALAVNERKAMNTRVLFFSPLTPGELSHSIYSPQEGGLNGR